MEEKEIRIRLEGLACAVCAGKIEEELRQTPHFSQVSINLLQGELHGKQKDQLQEDALLTEVRRIVQKHEPDVGVSYWKRETEGPILDKKKMYLRFGIGLLFFLLPPFLGGGWRLLYLVAYGIFGYDVLLTAIRNIGKRQLFDENFLMAIATIGAIFLGELAEAVFVMLFYQVGEAFQHLAVGRSRNAIKGLMELRAEFARVVTEDGSKEVSPEDVRIGDRILVRAGERIPLDGVLLEGDCVLDMMALTGESVPREVATGQDVLSGSVNMGGLLTIEVTTELAGSTVERILSLMEKAGQDKSKTEEFITEFARVYTPFVVLAASLLAVVPPLLGNGDFTMWLSRALVFLVISCPCALVISVPLTFFSGMGEASRMGLLVKGSNYLSALSQVDTVVFDKTGTLTKGVFSVVEIKPAEGVTEEEVLHMAAVGESFSNHPIARGILDYAGYEHQSVSGVTVEETGGLGMVYQYQGRVLLGSSRLMEKEGVSYESYEGIGTVVYVAKDGAYKGRIALADTLRPESMAGIWGLKELGIRDLYLLTGDREEVAKEVSERLGLSGYHAMLLPQDKLELLEKLCEEENKTVLFLGDGINDAPGLKRVDIGVAMGGIGSDAAMEAADVVLMEEDLSVLAKGIVLARNTTQRVKQNITLALGVKGVVLFLGALGIASMWMAVFADVGVSVLAILNAMRRKMGEEENGYRNMNESSDK